MAFTSEETNEAAEIEVESYRFVEVSWPGGPFEGRFMPRVKAEPTREHRTFPAGSIVVPLAQTLAKVAINLLEPEAPDSLLAWGFFNATFEQKEYGEHYVLETLAREMMEKDPALRLEFERRLRRSRVLQPMLRQGWNSFTGVRRTGISK